MMSNNIEQLKSKINTTELKLNELKQQMRSLSENEKIQKAQEIDLIMTEIKNELEGFKNKDDLTEIEIQALVDIESKYNILLNNSRSELLILENQVIGTPDSNPEEDNKKSNNLGRKLLIGGGVLGAGLLIRRWWKKGRERRKERLNKNNSSGNNVNTNNTKEKQSWWKKPLLRGGGILGGVALWKNWSRIKEKLGFGMSFEDSLGHVKGNLNNISESKIKANIGDLTYDESSGEIRSYGLSTGTKINKKKKRIDGLDVKFSTYSELIFIANFINFLKFHYKGRGANSSPFYTKKRTGDLYMKIGAHIDGKEKEEEVISGGMRSTLRNYVPSLDPGFIKKIFGFTGLVNTDGKNKLVGYLNNMDVWGREPRGQVQQTDPNNTPEHNQNITEAGNLQIEIENTRQELDHVAPRGKITVNKIGDSDFEYYIESWSFKQKVIFSPDIKLDGLNIVFPTVKEAMRTANLLNKMKNEYGGKCKNSNPFSFEYEYGHWGLYVNKKGEDMSYTARWRKIRVLTKSTLKKDYPTIYNKSNRKIFNDFINNLPHDGVFKGWE